MEPSIIFEDEYLLVLEKPSGITVNKSDTTTGEWTLQDWVEKQGKVSKVLDTSDTFSSFDTFFERTGIVHRLDKETSGILLVAKTKEAFVHLQKQFKERIVKKTYHALVHGTMEPRAGEIKAPLGRLPWNRKRFGVLPGGRESTTRYQVLTNYLSPQSKEQLSFIELQPETGRTHQIRVHVKYMGHPIFSDQLYGGRKTARDDRKVLSRLFLHASEISFTHPVSGKQVSFTSSLPVVLQVFLDKSLVRIAKDENIG